MLWVEWGLADPVRVFKKNEAEPSRKPLGRIVNGVSLVDQIITRMIFTNFNSKCGELYPNSPNMKGIGFSDDLATKSWLEFHRLTVTHATKDPNITPKSSDISGWEKAFSMGCAMIFTTVFSLTCSNYEEHRSDIDNYMGWWRYKTLGRLCIDDMGYVFSLNRHLGQNSGDLETTESNGAARNGVALENGSAASKTAGDDCLDWTNKTIDEMIAGYRSKQIICRGAVDVINEEYPFCSHINKKIGPGQAVSYLSEVDKTIFKAFTGKKPSIADVENYIAEFEHHPDHRMVVEFFDQLVEWVGTESTDVETDPWAEAY